MTCDKAAKYTFSLKVKETDVKADSFLNVHVKDNNKAHVGVKIPLADILKDSDGKGQEYIHLIKTSADKP